MNTLSTEGLVSIPLTPDGDRELLDRLGGLATFSKNLLRQLQYEIAYRPALAEELIRLILKHGESKLV